MVVKGLVKFLEHLKLERCGSMRSVCFLQPETLQVSREPQPSPWWPLRMKPGFRPRQGTTTEYLRSNLDEAIRRIREIAEQQRREAEPAAAEPEQSVEAQP